RQRWLARVRRRGNGCGDRTPPRGCRASRCDGRTSPRRTARRSGPSVRDPPGDNREPKGLLLLPRPERRRAFRRPSLHSVEIDPIDAIPAEIVEEARQPRLGTTEVQVMPETRPGGYARHARLTGI